MILYIIIIIVMPFRRNNAENNLNSVRTTCFTSLSENSTFQHIFTSWGHNTEQMIRESTQLEVGSILEVIIATDVDGEM